MDACCTPDHRPCCVRCVHCTRYVTSVTCLFCSLPSQCFFDYFALCSSMILTFLCRHSVFLIFYKYPTNFLNKTVVSLEVKKGSRFIAQPSDTSNIRNLAAPTF